MDKYINAEIAEKSLRQYAEQKHANGEIELANGILKAVCRLKTIPTADVKEVVRGKWIHIGENSTGKIFMCSVCDKCINPNKKDVELGRVEEKTTFCPSCDAKMEVE